MIEYIIDCRISYSNKKGLHNYWRMPREHNDIEITVVIILYYTVLLYHCIIILYSMGISKKIVFILILIYHVSLFTLYANKLNMTENINH